MPYFKDPGAHPATDRLTLPSDSSCWVDMKRRASYGDVTAAQRATVEITAADAARVNGRRRNGLIVDQRSGMAADFDGSAYLPALIAALIVDWNLDDADGHKAEITPENLKLLDAEDGEFLQAEAQKRVGGRPQDQQGPSRKPSSESSPPVAARPRIVKQPGS